jgi:hypothetical protein
MQEVICHIAARLGFDCSILKTGFDIPYIVWKANHSSTQYWFFTIASARIGEIVTYGEQPTTKGFIVIPASRTNLLIYKLRRDPRLNKAFNPDQGLWQFLKFRHLRSLAESPLLTRDNLEQLLRLDPLTYTTPQLRLL